MVWLKGNAAAEAALGPEASDSLAFASVLCAFSVYLAVVVVGFLLNVLEHCCVPREGRTYATLTCLLIFSGLWISEFLVLMYGRKFYTSFTAGLSGGLLLVRVCAAFAQLFVTHSLAMLGAIVMGHSCHFRKCPDLTWQATLFKGVPTAGLLGLYFALAVAFRYGQLWPVCRETFFHFAQAYIATSWALRIAGGLLLGAAALAYATRPALH